MKQAAPVSIAKWLGLAYAAAVALVSLRGVDAADSLLLSILVLPWIIGPAALAAFAVRELESSGAAWLFLFLEAVVVCSTAALWTYPILIAPDAQNGIAMLLFPAPICGGSRHGP